MQQLLYLLSGLLIPGWGGDQHSIKHSSRGTVRPETSRSLPLYCNLVAGRQAAATRGGKSKKGGDSWSTSCTIILKHHRERTREAAAAAGAAGETGEWIYGPLDFFFSAVNRQENHFVVNYPHLPG